MAHTEDYQDTLPEHYFRVRVPHSRSYIVRTYHVQTSAKLLCREIKKACLWSLGHPQAGDLAHHQFEIQGDPADEECSITLGHGDHLDLWFAVTDSVPATSLEPLARVHTICLWHPAFPVLKQINDRLEEHYRGRWRDDVPEISGAPLPTLHRPKPRGGRLPDESYDLAYKDIQAGVSFEQTLERHIERLKQRGDTIYQVEKPEIRRKLWKAVERRRKGQELRESRLD